MEATEFVDAAQDGNGVTATLRDLATGDTRTVRAGYLVGCDGARSRVRQVMGAKMEGSHAFAHNFNMILRIPEFIASPPAQRAIMYWIVNPASPGVISPLEADNGLWAFGVLLPPGVTEIADADVLQRFEAAVGRKVEAEVLTRDVWAAHRLIADRYRNGRMLLAGDACHLHPPFGGYGMNLGIADGVDLGWKLAAVVTGWGGEALLDSYETERRPVHGRTIAEAVANYSVLSDHLLKADLLADTPEGARAREEVGREIMATKTREFYTLGVTLGSRYDGSPVIVDDGSAPPPEHYSTFEPSAHPGCLAPPRVAERRRVAVRPVRAGVHPAAPGPGRCGHGQRGHGERGYGQRHRRRCRSRRRAVDGARPADGEPARAVRRAARAGPARPVRRLARRFDRSHALIDTVRGAPAVEPALARAS